MQRSRRYGLGVVKLAAVTVEVHVSGRIETGRFADFTEAASHWVEYRDRTGYVRPRLLQALSGEMNAVLLVFEYPDLGAYEREEARVFEDGEYVRLAMAMPFVGPLRYVIYRFI